MGVQNPNERVPVKVKVKAPPQPKPEVTRPVTPKQTRAINQGVRQAQQQQAVKTAVRTAQKISGHHLQAVHENLIDSVLTPGEQANKVLKANHGSPFQGGIASSYGHAVVAGAEHASPIVDAVRAISGAHVNTPKTAMAEGGPDVVAGKALTGLLGAAKGTAENPGKVIGATVKSVPGAVEGIVAGPVNLVEHPGATIKGLERDYANRYGKNASKTVQQEGLLPYALDVGAGGAIVGHVAGKLAKEGLLGEKAANTLRPRPQLRVRADFAQQQDRSSNLFTAAGQNALDARREKASVKRQNTGHARGIEPQNPNEVVPLTKAGAEKQFNKSFGVRSNVNRVLHGKTLQSLRDVFQKEMPKTLTKDQMNRGAFRYALEHGIRTPEQASTFLPKLREDIAGNRQQSAMEFKQAHDAWVARGKKGREPQPLPIASDELPHIDWLIKHPEVFDAKLGAMADKVRSLGHTLGANDPKLLLKDQLERNVTPQALLLGVGRRNPGERISTYVQRVRAAREQAGLAQPGFFHHAEALRPRFAAFTRGTGIHGAPRGPHQTDYVLMKNGAAVVHPDALQNALASNVKSTYGVSHVANTVAGFALRHLVDQHTGQRINVRNVTFNDLHRALERSGVKDVVPYRPNTVFERTHDENLNAGLSDPTKFLGDAYRAATDPAHVKGEHGWYLIPKAIDKQMKDSLRFNHPALRLLAKNKAFNTNIILGQNPSWPMMRVLHNLGSSAIFNVNPFAALQAGRHLTPEEMKTLNTWVSADPFHYERHPVRIGGSINADSRLAALRDIAVSDTKAGKAIRAANPGAWARTLARPAMAGERHQMAFFRRAAAYQKLTKEARTKVYGDVSGLVGSLHQMLHEATNPEARAAVSKARSDITHDPQQMEQLAHYVNNVYGDFSHYAGLHRLLQQNVMFYGFLRYATRVVLKELPTKHPLKAALLYNLSQQNERNTRDVLGLGPTDPLPFGAESNVYNKGPGGITVQNFHRANPFGAVTLEHLTDPIAAAESSLPFAFSEAASQAFRADLLRRHGWRVDSSAAEKGIGDHVSAGDRARILLEDFLRQSAPYRVWDNIVAGGRKMGNDSLAFSPRPVIHKQTQAIANDIVGQNFGKKVGTAGEILKAEFPFAKIPSRDDVLALQVKQNEERLAGKNLTAQQKAAEEKKLRSQPGYQSAFAKAQVLSKQRSKHRGRKASPYDQFFKAATTSDTGQYSQFFK